MLFANSHVPWLSFFLSLSLFRYMFFLTSPWFVYEPVYDGGGSSSRRFTVHSLVHVPFFFFFFCVRVLLRTCCYGLSALPKLGRLPKYTGGGRGISLTSEIDGPPLYFYAISSLSPLSLFLRTPPSLSSPCWQRQKCVFCVPIASNTFLFGVVVGAIVVRVDST